MELNIQGTVLRRLTAATLLVAVLLSSLPWEVAVAAGSRSGADALLALGCSFSVPTDDPSSAAEPGGDLCACLCSLCPASVLGCQAAPGDALARRPLVRTSAPLPPDRPSASGGLSRPFRPPRLA